MKYEKILATIIVVALIASSMVVMNKVTDIKIIEQASATPGYNEWGNGSLDYEYSADAQLIYINATGLNASSTYYLRYPIYAYAPGSSTYTYYWSDAITASGGGGEYRIETPASTTYPCTVQLKPDPGTIVLNVSGPWIFCETKTNVVKGNNYENWSSEVATWFWVNSSTEWTLNDLSDFKYGVNTSHTIVATGPTTGSYIDIISHDNSIPTIVHNWNTTTGLIFHDYTYRSTMYAGNYSVRAYRDMDGISVEHGYGTSTQGYNTSYGTIPSITANYYSWTYCGPWDPPEINATETIFRVTPGSPQLSIPSGNNTMYWNFSGEVNLSVKDASDDNLAAANYHVEVYNSAGSIVAVSPGHADYDADTENLNITKYNGYVLIGNNTDSIGAGWGWNYSSSSAFGTNGTWKIYIWSDLNGDRTNANRQWTEEWNGTATFRVSRAPGVQFKWIDDDDYLSTTNNDGELKNIPVVTNNGGRIVLEFQIISDEGTFFGAGTGVASESQAMENISISGDSLYTGSLDKMPGVAFNSSKTWSVPIIPTMAVGGGSIRITASWSGKGSITETLSVGGANYATNGSVVTVTPSTFDIGSDQTLEVTVTDANGYPNPWANVYLYYLGDAYDATNGKVVTTEVNHQFGGGTSDGKYYIGFNKTQQRTNQTTVGFSAVRAPRNLTVYAVATNSGYGYARIRMEPKSEMHVEIFPETYLAGYQYDHFYVNTTIVNETGQASTTTPDADDYAAFFVRIYNETNVDVTNNLGASHSNFADEIDDDYTVDVQNVYFTVPGTYTVYAYNNTHDSAGYNATIEIKQATVTCDKEFFVWNSDDNISATFTISGTDIITGTPLMGEFRIDNLSTDGNYNKTYTNTSFDGSSDTGTPSGNSSLLITASDGLAVSGDATIITVEDITANFLPAAQSVANITYWFRPENANGNLGAWARCIGRTPVQVPAISSDKMYIPLSVTSTITFTTVGRDDNGDGAADTIANVFVGLDGRGISVATTNGTTGGDGTIQFSVIPTSTGNIDIHVGADGRVIEDKIVVTGWELDISTAVAQVSEGDPFTVTCMRKGTTTVVEDALVTITGIGSAYSNADGEAEFTAPKVSSDSTYTITASKEGYKPDSDLLQIKVINVPELQIILPDTDPKGKETFKIYIADDTGSGIIGAAVVFNSKTYTSKSNGEVTITAPDIKSATDYTISVSFGTYDTSTATIKIQPTPGTPGFELLTLIAAIGIAFILLRRRKK